MRTISLTERRTTLTRLHSEDVCFLLREHEQHLRIVPTAKKHQYQITPTHHVGVIVAPRCRLLIRPKFPLRSLFLLQDIPELHATENNPTQGLDLIDLLTTHLVSLIHQLIHCGLQRGYVENQEQASFLRGRLDVAAQLRDSASASTQFQCHTDQFSIDVPCNQILKSTLNRLLDTGLLSPNVRERVMHVDHQMDQVSLVRLSAERIAPVIAHPGATSYRTALRMCQWMLEGLNPIAQSVASGPEFLINLEQAFERYVTRAFSDVTERDPRLRCIAQGDQVIANSLNEGEDLSLRPDVVIEQDQQVKLVLDVKWKSLKKTGPNASDLYQLITYCSSLGAKRGILLYPGKRARIQSWSMTQIPVTIEAKVIPVVGEAQACRDALRQYLERIVR